MPLFVPDDGILLTAVVLPGPLTQVKPSVRMLQGQFEPGP